MFAIDGTSLQISDTSENLDFFGDKTNQYNTKTSLTSASAMFKELYFLRWGIESKYKELKCSVEIEEFSSKKPITIKQDFYASIYLSILSSLIKKEADAEN